MLPPTDTLQPQWSVSINTTSLLLVVVATAFCCCCSRQSCAAALIHNITRVFNNGDIFNNPDVNCRPMHCSVYGANSARNSGCDCQCPLSRPAFLQHVKKCADSISDCRMLYFGIHGQTESRLRMPTVFLPLGGQLLSPSLPLDWSAAGIKPDVHDGSVPCQLSSIGYLTHSGWIPLETAHLFSLLNSNQHTHIQWLGNKQDQQSLTGKIVEVSLQCQDAESPDVCAVFRVIGRDVEQLPGQDATNSDGSAANAAGSNGRLSSDTQERNSQLGLIVGIVCGVILAMSLAVITVFWTICWKQQKDRLAKKIHLHLLLQQRLQEQNPGVFRHFPRPYVGLQDGTAGAGFQNYPVHPPPPPTAYGLYPTTGSHVWNANDKMHNGPPYQGGNRQRLYKHSAESTVAPPPPPPPPYGRSRKRLYFNPEFFEADKMANPPPHAEQFLHEVRSMIDLARLRIRGRRYTPSLVVIPEEERSTNSSKEADLDSAETAANNNNAADDDANGVVKQWSEKVNVWLSRHGPIDPHSGPYFTYGPYRTEQHRQPLDTVSWFGRKTADTMQQYEVLPAPTRRASCPSLALAAVQENWPQDGIERDSMTEEDVKGDNATKRLFYANDIIRPHRLPRYR